MARAYWQPGAPILLRGVWRGRVWTARPATMVRDTPELTVVYMMPGTVCKLPSELDEDRLPPAYPDTPWRLVDRPWYGGGALCLSEPGRPYTILAFFDAASGRVRQWYVNLQEPFRRTALGFDYRDLALDIVISPDLREWHWKDEDDFADLLRRGRVGPDEARSLRAAGEEVMRRRLDPGSPFLQGWERWSPPPDWPVPGLPAGWDHVE